MEFTVLMRAAEKGHTDCVRLLIDGGAKKEAKDNEGMTALMFAAANRHMGCLRLLLALVMGCLRLLLSLVMQIQMNI